jgi:hypothetical protein
MHDDVNTKKLVLSTKPNVNLKRNEIINEDDITYTQQLSILNQFYMDMEDTNANKDKDNVKTTLLRELEKKWYGYRQQDIKKDIYNENKFIAYADIIEKLVASKLKCYYCRTDMKIIYKFVRDNQQWTLDRIFNDDGHTKENTIVCCLKCNLERRCTHIDKFDFTKKLSISKIKKIV